MIGSRLHKKMATKIAKHSSLLSNSNKACFGTVKLPQEDKLLKDRDPEMAALVREEIARQKKGIILIASENFTSSAVMQAVGSPLMNKYSEGYPGRRYYGGCMVIDKIEDLCKKRALNAFHADPEKWDVNVQALSGAPANFTIYTALVPPGGRLMGLDLTCGGHLSHGYQTPKKKVSATSLFWDSQSYGLKDDGYIDYDGAYETAQKFKPNIVICGYSAYPRDLDYKRFREIADSVGAYLLADVAHYSGLLVGELLKSPFEYADIVSTTTHKSLRGPRGSLIFYK